jgi:hypothetical protein
MEWFLFVGGGVIVAEILLAPGSTLAVAAARCR